MFENLQNCRTAEECLELYATWFTAPDRNSEDIGFALRKISIAVGEEIEILYASMGILLNEKSEVLLLKRKANDRSYPSSWSFPGGRADPPDEDLAITAVRETYQETGLGFHVQSLHSVRYTTIANRFHCPEQLFTN